jgi:hypothetical protein
MFTQDKKVAMAKIVSEAFKEKHSHEWRKANPTNADIVDQIIDIYGTEARWVKAISHLRERDEIKDGPEDIGPLMREIVLDTWREYEDEIKEALFKHFKPKIQRGLTRNFVPWYKARVAVDPFGQEVRGDVEVAS